MGEMVSFKANGGTAEGYLATPASGAGAGVIVIQEWWGLNDQIKSVADMLAREGFVALAPDFYHGAGAAIGEPDEAGKLMMALEAGRAAADARGAAEYLSALTGGTVGVIGFCMGGQLSLLTGTVAPDGVGAVVDCYGIHPNIKPDYSKMRAPVLGLFAGNDEHVDDAARSALAEALTKAGVAHEIHVYPGVEHGFLNDQRPDAYDKDAAEDAWGRILAFYRANLR